MGNTNQLKISLAVDSLFRLNLCRQHIMNLCFGNVTPIVTGTGNLNNLHQNTGVVFLDDNMKRSRQSENIYGKVI